MTMGHKTERPRWVRSAKLLSLLLAVAFCTLGLVQAFAAVKLDPLSGYLTLEPIFDDEDNEFWYPDDSDSKIIYGAAYSKEDREYSGSVYKSSMATLKIANCSSEDFTLEFDWNTLDEYVSDSSATGSVSVDGNTSREGHFSKPLTSGGSIIITVTSPENKWSSTTRAGATTITLSNFKITSAADTSVTLVSSEDGAYTVSTGGASAKMVEAGAAAQTYGFDSTKGITVKAAPAEGKHFYMWWDPTTKVPYSTKEEETLFLSNNQTIQPVFVDEAAYAQNFLVRHDNTDQYFVYWEDVMQMAAANQSHEKNVVLLTDYTLPTAVSGHTGTYVAADGTYSLPAGVTLVVPYDAKNDTSPTTTKNCETEPGRSNVFRTLTVPSGVRLKVPSAATLIVNAVQGARNGAASMGRIVSDYGKLEVNGALDVTGTLYARGFVTGSGEVTANSSSKIYQLMQIQDWRGGSVTFNMYQYLMAINEYSFENIMANMTYEGGSQLLVQACIVAGNACVAVDVPAMTDGSVGDSIFVLDQGGQIKTAYDAETDRLNIRITKGKVTMKCLTLDMSKDQDGLKIDSKEYPLAVNDSMRITVESGATLQTDYKLKFLPGSSVTVEKGATMIVSKDSELYFYSRGSYATGYANDRERTRLNYDLIDRAGETVKPTEDAKLDVYGTLEVYGTLMQSDDGKGGLEPHTGAQIIMHNDPVTEAKVNECYKLGKEQYGNAVANGSLYYTVVDNWCAIKGRMAESADDGTNGAFTPFAEMGTYKPVNIGGKFYWYQYQVDYTYGRANDVDNTVVLPTKETTYISRSTANHAVASVGGQRFVAVAGTAVPADVTVAAGKASVNKLADGVEDVALANVREKTAVTLTVRPYTYRVTWEEYASADAAAANNTFAHYVTGDTDSATWSEEPTLTIRGQENAAATVVEATKTVNISDITNDAIIKVNVDYTSYPVKVRVVIPDASITMNDGAQIGVNIIDLPKEQFTAVPNAEYLYSQTYTADKATGIIEKGIEMTQYFKMISDGLRTMGSKFGMELTGVAESGYYVIDKVQVTAGNATVAPDFRSSTLLVSDVKSAVEVTVTLKHKDYMATFAINEGSPLWYRIPGNTTTRPDGAHKDNVTADAAYFDAGEAVVLLNTQVRGGNNCGFKYMFTGSTDSAATVAEDKFTFNTTGVTGDVTVNASMTYYDFIATLKTKDGKVLKGIYMQDYVSDVQLDKQGKLNSYVRYTADFDEVHYLNTTAPLPYAEAQKVSSGIYSYMSYTYTFDGAVSLNEMGESGKLYTVSQTTIPNGATTREIDSLTVLAVNAEAGGTTNVAVTAESYYNETTKKQTAITENCVVTVDPVAYDHIVTFVDESGNQLARQYVAKDGTATYTAAEKYVVKEAEITSGSNTGTVTNNGTTVEVSGLTGNPKITLTTAKYDSCVTWSITKDGTQYTANQFIVSSGSTYETVALLGDDVSALAGITIDGNNAVLTAGNKLVVANGATYTTASSTAETVSQTADTVAVPASASGTVRLELRGYDYTVTFVNGEAEEMQYVRNDKNVLSNYNVYYKALTQTVITGYTGVTDAVAKGDSQNSSEVADGWTAINLSSIKDNMTVTLTTAHYDYKLQWTIKYPDGTPERTLQPRYVLTGTEASYAAPDGYLIDKVVLADGKSTISEDAGTVTISGVMAASVTATVTLKSAVTHLITYRVNDGAATVADPTGGAWTYTPDSGYEITGAVVTGDAGVIVTNLRTSLTITGITDKPINVAITTAPTTTEPTAPEGEAVALWGDMSYQYYRCASVYRWNGTDANNGQWTPADTFAWRHSAGSRSYTVGGKSYTVPNGSIMLVNSTAKPVTYTVKLEADTNTVVGMRWSATGKQENIHTNERDLIVITVPAGENILVTGEMFTLPNAEVESGLTDKNIGHITVGTATVSEN